MRPACLYTTAISLEQKMEERSSGSLAVCERASSEAVGSAPVFFFFVLHKRLYLAFRGATQLGDEPREHRLLLEHGHDHLGDRRLHSSQAEDVGNASVDTGGRSRAREE